MNNISFSGMQRVDECPTSTVLPQSRTTNPHSSRGHELHTFLANVSLHGRDEALSRVPLAYRKACEIIDLNALPSSRPESYAVEVAYALHVEQGTAREIGRALNRGYERFLRPGEIPGTMDVVGLSPTEVEVWDFKSGWSDLGPVRENWQLRIGALAAARALGRTRARIGIIRLKDDGESYYDAATLDELDLDATEHAVRMALLRVEAAKSAQAAGQALNTSEGSWCRYCPAFTACPAKMNLVRAALLELEVGAPAVLNAENAPKVYQRLEAVAQVLDRVWASLNEFARLSPIQLPGGKQYGEVKWPSTTIDPEKAFTVLAERLGVDNATAAINTKKTLTLEALKEAARAHLRTIPGGGRMLGKTVDALVEELVRVGAAKRSTAPQMRETKVPKAEQDKPAALPAAVNEDKSHAA